MSAETEDALSGLGSDYALWRGLLDHPAWAKLREVGETAVSTRANAVMNTRLGSLEEALGQEFTKGEANGIALLMSLPQSEMERLEHEMKDLRQQLEGEQDATGSTSTDTDDGIAGDLIDDGNDAFAG